MNRPHPQPFSLERRELERSCSIFPTPFPKNFKDQLAAIRDLLRTQGDEWSIDTIAQHFKNATRSKAKILSSLEALETLGILTRHTENTESKWYYTDLQTTA